MKKYLGNLLVVIASVMCMTVLFWSSSISSEAAAAKGAKDIKLVENYCQFTAASDGYYSLWIQFGDDKSDKWMDLETNKKLSANETYKEQFWLTNGYNPGKVTVYVVWRAEKKGIIVFDIERYKKDPNYVVKSYSTTISKREAQPQDVKVEVSNDRTYIYRYMISWKDDGLSHTFCYPDPKGTSGGLISKGSNYVLIAMDDYEKKVELRTLSRDYSTYADSEPVSVTLPAVDTKALFDKGELTIDLSEGSTEVSDPMDMIRRSFYGYDSLDFLKVKVVASPDRNGRRQIDLDLDGEMDIEIVDRQETDTYKVLSTNSVKDEVTFTLSDEIKTQFIKERIPFYSPMTIILPKESTQGSGGMTEEELYKKYAGKSQAPVANDNATDTASAPKKVIVDDITYLIDVNGKATALKIDSKKKAGLNTVTVAGKTYPVVAIANNACKNNRKINTVTIGSNVESIGNKAFFKCKKLGKVTIQANKSLKIGKGAFKKIGKDATIKVKGVKGSTRKKLIRAINK
ncbi:leucine-rich repeat protein [Butyrivibrio sp. WCD3002]|uniref:leucine-rich repeat protein n=1 Tax=Butyrivibrio sp. WCD3002 TaxID=1280676 RepID=UPI00040CD777|nr:leucine-rich repeat protein [Butyrivibrio sp. WCD3002]